MAGFQYASPNFYQNAQSGGTPLDWAQLMGGGGYQVNQIGTVGQRLSGTGTMGQPTQQVQKINGNYVYTPITAGQIQGATNQKTTGSTGTGFNVNSLLEEEPVPPTPDYDAMIAPALAAYGQAESAAQGESEADISGLQSGLAGQRETQAKYIAGEERRGSLEEEKQRQLARGQTNQQRSALAEVLQGLQALFGGTTGTGRFAGELAGRTTAQNIGGIQTGLQNAVVNIQNTLATARDRAQQAVTDAERQTQNLIEQVKAQLQTTLANIRMKSGELQATKAQWAENAMQQYQNTMTEINARNTAFKQNVAMQLYQTEQALRNQLVEQSYAQNINFPDTISQFQNLGLQPYSASIGANGQPTYTFRSPTTTTEEEEQDLF